jgi:hypothetical protein
MKKSKKTLKDLFQDLELVENLLNKLESDNLEQELSKLEGELNKLSDLEEEYSKLTEKDINLSENNLDTKK